jgi:hypothetical protein
MKHAASVICFFLLVATLSTASAQVGQLCLFSDPQGTDCAIRDTAPGILHVCVVHTQAVGVSSVTFSAPKPACMVGATWLSDTHLFPVAIGDSQHGLAVGYGACLSSPIHVMTINYLVQGTTTADCPYQVLPGPIDGLSISDCDFNRWDGQVSTTYINSTLPCTCNMSGSPQLSVNPTSLDFGSTQVNKSFTIANVGGGTLEWTISESVPWLAVSPASGTNNATVNVTVDRSALPVGIHTGSIFVTSNAGSTTVTARVDVQGPPVLGLSPTALQIPATSSGSAISIWNDGGGTLTWNITSDQPWLSANPPSGVGDDQVAVYVDRAGLTPGTYYGNLFVTSNGGNATVSVETIATDAVLIVNPNLLIFTPSTPTNTFWISNGGSGTLNWSLELFDPWVTASPLSGTGSGVVTVNVDVWSLPCCHMLLGHIRVNSNGGSEVIELKAYPTGPGTGGSIGIYADVAGTECNLSDAAVGMTTYHVVHLADFGMTACAYWAPKPSCFTATYLSDTNIFPVTIGNSQAGVSIGYGSCRPGPIHVQSILFFTQGTTPQCCLYPILGIPSSGNVEAVDCANHLITAYGVTSVINPNGACTCGSVKVEESTWGRVKSLYSE